MRGGQGRQPLDVPLVEGLGNTACSLECLACLNHVHGWTIWGGYGTLPLKPRFLVASDRSQVARRRVRLDLGDLGIIEQQLSRARTNGSQAFASCDAFASSWSIPAYSWIGFFFHHPSPLPRATYDWAYPIGSPFSIAMYGVTDSCAKTLGKYCSVRQQVSGVLLLRPTTRRYEIDLATHRASQGHAQS